MSLTVFEAMKLGRLNECRIVAGHAGIKKEIKYVTVMEVPDIVNWLKGGELILTSLYPIKDDAESQIRLIKDLYEVGTVALAIKPNRFIDEIPSLILEEADKYNMPIIEIKESISYLDLMVPVMQALFSNQMIYQEDIAKANQIVNDIAVASKGIAQLTEILKEKTGNDITIETQLRYLTVPNATFDYKSLSLEQRGELMTLKQPVLMKRQRENQAVDCIVTPLFIDGKAIGYLTCWGVRLTHVGIDIAIMEKASTLFTLEFQKQKINYEVQQQYKNDFIRELLFNNVLTDTDLYEWGEKYGFLKKNRYVCVLLGNKKHHFGSEALALLEPILELWEQQGIYTAVRGYLSILLPIENAQEDQIKKRVENILTSMQSRMSEEKLYVGIGGFHEGIKGIRRSYAEAEKALRLSTHHSLTHYKDLGVFRLLDFIDDQEALREFYDETVGLLKAYDSDNQLDLLHTLISYLHYNSNLKMTADALFIHVNTLKYRLKRIHAITGYDIHQTEDLLNLQIGLKIAYLLREIS
ncbi:CdaR family transcriptional regulator [Pullulanibacillus camelliae]|uniref:CdaR family transcriptional regulator n=1 Tax=Pullulanibacillus camelliae TaxID=1707096 RepID=A0A8J2YF14_9BACL|nr:PucR family transcriptional regulator [Pullulanibacillus camelliae]GGE27552.1 CdaR family transcriptional regulator [Pullulanibacillus camelliae]